MGLLSCFTVPSLPEASILSCLMSLVISPLILIHLCPLIPPYRTPTIVPVDMAFIWPLRPPALTSLVSCPCLPPLLCFAGLLSILDTFCPRAFKYSLFSDESHSFQGPLQLDNCFKQQCLRKRSSYLFTPPQIKADPLPMPSQQSAALAPCCCSVAQSCLTLCNPRTAACQASLSFTISQNLLRLMSIVSMMPSNHLILCHPLLPSIFPSIRVFSNELAV